MITVFSPANTGISVQIMFFQMVENAGCVVSVTATLPEDKESFEAVYKKILLEALAVHMSAKPVDGADDAAASGNAAVNASDKAAACVVITADSARIRTEQSVSGGLIKTAYRGETYELIKQSGDWYVVKVDGRTGYIHKGVAAIQ